MNRLKQYSIRKNRKSLLLKRLFSCMITGAILGILDYALFLTDYLVSGRHLGSSALSGLTAMNPFITLLTFINIIIPAGTAAAIAQTRGTDNTDRTDRLYGQGIIVTAFLGVLFSGIVFLVSTGFFGHAGIPAEAVYHARQYCRGLIFMPMCMFFNTYFYFIHVSEGFEKTCVASSAAKIAVNIPLAVIFGHLWGTFGVGMAATLGYLASLIIKLVPVIRRKLRLRFRLFFSVKQPPKLAAAGFSLSSDFICPVLFSTLMNICISARYGNRGLIIFSIILNIESLFVSLYSCLANSVSALIFQNFAEQNYVSIRRIEIYLSCFTAAVSVVLSVIFLLLSGSLPGVFGVRDAALIGECTAAIRLYVPFVIFLGLSTLLSKYYTCIRHRVYGYFFAVLSSVILPVICQFVFSAAGIQNGIWLGLGAGYPAAFFLNFLLIRKIRKVQNTSCSPVLLLDTESEKRQLSYDIHSERKEIMDCVYDMNARLGEIKELSEIRRNRLVFLTEENCMNIADQNPDGKTDIEISVICPEDPGDEFLLTIRSNGILTDVTDNHALLRSFREYVLSSLMAGSAGNYFLSKKTDTTISVKV